MFKKVNQNVIDVLTKVENVIHKYLVMVLNKTEEICRLSNFRVKCSFNGFRLNLIKQKS